MTRIIYTYHTNSFKIIKSTFSIYEFPHESVIFLINLGIFNCFENSDRAEFPTNCADLRMVGWRLPPAPPEFPPLILRQLGRSKTRLIQ